MTGLTVEKDDWIFSVGCQKTKRSTYETKDAGGGLKQTRPAGV